MSTAMVENIAKNPINLRKWKYGIFCIFILSFELRMYPIKERIVIPPTNNTEIERRNE
jgi:hypothetical protein